MTHHRPFHNEALAAVRDYFATTMRHPIGLLGVAMTTLCALLMLILMGMSMAGVGGNPYLGIITFLVLPGGFLLGLVLMPVSRWRQKKHPDPTARLDFPVLDLNLPRVRNRFVLFLAITVVNLVLLAVAAAGAIEFMDSVEFCGKTCHAVMQPELTAHQNSPHARVRCVDCHIGPGAGWFVRSKLSGTRQVFATIFHSYPTPIPTPVENLRPARETCEQCHWPTKFHGTRLLVRRHFREDEANTEVQTVLALKIGGGAIPNAVVLKIGGEAIPDAVVGGNGAEDISGAEGAEGAATVSRTVPASAERPLLPEAAGIHWHVATRVEFLADPKRETISLVRVHRPDGTVKEYRRPGAEVAPKDSTGQEQRLRTMDCVDCHNRPAHIYKPATRALEEAMVDGHISTRLPFIRREALAAVQRDYPSSEAAQSGIADHLRSFYEREYPALDAEQASLLPAAIAGVQGVYARNVFPAMRVGWGTYPNHIGHEASPGCFRCHDEELATSEGETISQDCGLCHSLLAIEEENPPILQQMFGEGGH
jgi:nitrate/TMAO reductase-like tetraheme cytochrome c subunit